MKIKIFPPYGTGSSRASIFGVRIFQMPKTAWYYRPMMKLYCILRRIDKGYYYLHYRFRKRQHILRLPIPYTWVDADERMFQACFTILGQYVEAELGREPYSYQNEDSLYRGYRLHAADGRDETAIDLWLWYKNELPALEKDYHDDIMACYSGKMTTKDLGNGMHEVVDFGRVKKPKYAYGHIEDVKEEKLKLLMEMRRALWT